MMQAYAIRILKDKFPAIVDAIDPGGSGDMYAGLNEEESAALLRSPALASRRGHGSHYKRLGLRPARRSHR